LSRALTARLSPDDRGTPRGLTRAELMTATEVAELLGVPVSTVREWAATARCPGSSSVGTCDSSART